VASPILLLILARINYRVFNRPTFEKNVFKPITKTPRGSHNTTDIQTKAGERTNGCPKAAQYGGRFLAGNGGSGL
jgi:hypothetical protein